MNTNDAPQVGLGRGSTITQPAASVQGVSKSFGQTRALSNVSISVEPGAIRGLLGRNGSGKSTLVSILTGLLAPDTGEVYLAGRRTPPVSRRAEWSRLVGCVYQRSSLVPDLSVAENLFLGRQHRGGIISWPAMYRSAATILTEWGLDIDPRARLRDLGVSQQQLVEIVRATRSGAGFVVLDEPTSRLSAWEVSALFSALGQLRDRGIGVMFISHYLQEAFEICDDLTVLRDGRIVAEAKTGEIDQQQVVAAMVGDDSAPTRKTQKKATARAVGAPLLEVSGLRLAGQAHDVSLTVRSGECLGLAGLNGSGNRQVAEALSGLARHSGTVRMSGQTVRARNVKAALRAGIGLVPADRHYNGLVPQLTVADNITLPVIRQVARYGVIRPSAQRQAAQSLIDRVGVAGGSATTPVDALSGGNQQKVVIGRALATKPELLVLVEPTAGVDIASSELIFGAVRAALDGGTAVLVVSDRPEEFVTCDRVLVMSKGAVVGEFGKDWTDEALVAAMEGISLDDEH